MVKKYRKKPVEILALNYNGDNKEELKRFLTVNGEKKYKELDGLIYIDTLEGRVVLRRGEYIICGTSNEFYSCKPDIFDTIYEGV